MRRADRLFQIVQLIRGRRLSTAAFLAERLEVSQRTIYRDVADLHVRCMEVPGLAGERFMAAGKFMKFIEIGKVLRDNLPASQTRKVPTRKMPNWMVHLLALFNPGIRTIKSELGKTRSANASHAFERLGWKTRDEEATIIDCANSLIEHGVVKF